MKTMQPSDWDEKKVRFPCILQPKIDGVRAHNPDGVLLGRSNKPIRNIFTRERYSAPEYKFWDGELAAQDERHPELCRLTTSATSTIEGEPYTLWHIFDCVSPTQIERPYIERLRYLHNQIGYMQQNYGLALFLRAIPYELVENMDQLNMLRSRWLDEGYEGSIIRDPYGMHKQGRSTVKEMGVLRIKDFIDFEFRIEKIVEGKTNLNEATENERGETTRSTHQENMVPNGMVGALEGPALADVLDPQTGAVLIRKDQWVTVGAGRMDHKARKHYFESPHELLMQIGKAQMFPKGIKDKPRFPTFQCLRHPDDMGE
jgi:DNA ligase-1